ncbi:MarR family winged helix-turn-helix transcriptional regulator [Geodermatophilus sp. SYSU D00700]
MHFEEATRTNRTFVKVARLYRAAQAAQLERLGLHPGQDVLLWVLGQAPNGLTVSDLADQLGVEPPTVTRSLIRLERGDWFTREPVPGDRRRVRLVLTERGRGLVPHIADAWQQVAESATRGLPPVLRTQLVDLLEQVQVNLQAVVDDPVLAGDEESLG